MPVMHNIDGDPIDGTPIKEVVHVSDTLAGIYILLGSAGIVFAIICLSFSIHFRQKR